MTAVESDFPAYYAELKRAGQLDRLLDPHPERAAAGIIETITRSHEPTFHNIHAKSMFAGKTTTALGVATDLHQRELSIAAYQPTTAMRYGSAQTKSLITNDGLMLPAFLTPPDLESVVAHLKSLDETPSLAIIDEVMMYIGNAGDPEKAIRLIEEIRQMGIHVMTTGIDYTFQGYDFTFMNELGIASRSLPNWHDVEMSTACSHCGERAKGSRRYTVDKQTGERRIAKRSEPFLEAGGDTYEAVCMEKHLSYQPD